MLIPIMIVVLYAMLIITIIVLLVIDAIKRIKRNDIVDAVFSIIAILLILILVLASVYSATYERRTSGRLVGSECNGVKGSSDGVAIKVIDSGGNVVE